MNVIIHFLACAVAFVAFIAMLFGLLIAIIPWAMFMQVDGVNLVAFQLQGAAIALGAFLVLMLSGFIASITE